MNTVFWIIQGILAAIFATAGIMKSIQSNDKLVKNLPWVNDFSLQTIRFIGISELLGGIGIIIPMVTGILPTLTSFAASGLAVIMILAALHHFPKREYKEVLFNATLFIPLAIVAVYRF